jgi:hypothetical protein
MEAAQSLRAWFDKLTMREGEDCSEYILQGLQLALHQTTSLMVSLSNHAPHSGSTGVTTGKQ